MSNNVEQKAFDTIVDNGISDPWQSFGMLLSNDGAISTSLVRAVFYARKDKTKTSQREVFRIFHEKLMNLERAWSLLKSIMFEYDRDAIWEELDASLSTMKISDALSVLQNDFGIHPFPIVLKSLEFNWTYMKKHGVRSFYRMTLEYIEKLLTISTDARGKYTLEIKSGKIKPYWLIRLDLISIETPTHCDVCRVTIATILAIRDQFAESSLNNSCCLSKNESENTTYASMFH